MNGICVCVYLFVLSAIHSASLQTRNVHCVFQQYRYASTSSRCQLFSVGTGCKTRRPLSALRSNHTPGYFTTTEVEVAVSVAVKDKDKDKRLAFQKILIALVTGVVLCLGSPLSALQAKAASVPPSECSSSTSTSSSTLTGSKKGSSKGGDSGKAVSGDGEMCAVSFDDDGEDNRAATAEKESTESTESTTRGGGKNKDVAAVARISPAAAATIEDSDAASMLILVESYEEKLESNVLKQKREPKVVMKNIQNKLSAVAKARATLAGEGEGGGGGMSSSSPPTNKKEKQQPVRTALEDAKDRILVLKAYLDEAERDLFAKNWDNLQVYLYTFADQENAFVALIDGLFPSDDKLDKAARAALSFEARSMFIALDDLREAARNKSNKLAQGAYSRLLLSYDRFLKAGDLYPTYDPITSTAVFFTETNNDKSTLRFDASTKVQVLDTVLLTEGPDMGKTGTVINIDGDNAVVKLDKDGKAYQEVKYLKVAMLAKTLDSDYNKKKGSGGSSSSSSNFNNNKNNGKKMATTSATTKSV